MIVPSKHLSEERSLLSVGGHILRLLTQPKTVSRLWDELNRHLADQGIAKGISFDWFVLALDFLYTIGAIEYEKGQVRRAGS